MNNKGKSAGGCMGICSVLTIVFVVLKLTGVISWKWVWVLAPTLIPLALDVVCLLILVIITYAEDKIRG